MSSLNNSTIIIMHTFDTTGVKVLQLESAAVTSDDLLNKTEAAVIDSESLTAEELARLAGVCLVWQHYSMYPLHHS